MQINNGLVNNFAMNHQIIIYIDLSPVDTFHYTQRVAMKQVQSFLSPRFAKQQK